VQLGEKSVDTSEGHILYISTVKDYDNQDKFIWTLPQRWFPA
jgi:hypothetical protein